MKFSTTILLIVIVSKFQTAQAQKIVVANFETLKQIIYKPNNTTYIVNFFASWCKPCVQELPELITYCDTASNVSLVLVSLDFKRTYQTTLLPLLKKLHYTATTYLLVDRNTENWMNKIDSSWSGGLPATLLVNTNKKIHYFKEGIINNFNTFLHESNN